MMTGDGAERGRLARRLMRSRSFGVLSTHSVAMEGYPFGSMTPYVPDRDGVPLILISSLAQHTRNIQASPKVSLTVWEETGGDPQASGRVTWLGEARGVPGEDEDARSRYLRYLPEAEGHFQMHDFSLYRIDPVRVRYIGGFGKIFWVDPADMILASPFAGDEGGILDHVNDDHADGLRRCVAATIGQEPVQIRMVGCDPEGFEVLADGRRLRVEFDEAATDLQQVRQQMIAAFRR